MKICGKCNIEKPLDDFYVEKRNKSGLMGSCKECYNLNQKKWRLENIDFVLERSRLYTENNKKKVLLASKKYRTENKEKLLVKSREYREENKKKINDGLKLWKLKNREKVLESRKRERDRAKIDIIFNLKNRMRCRLHHFLTKSIVTKKSKTFDILGCSPNFLKEHLEKQFKSGMTWDNRNEWHIDHIIPLSSAKTEEEIYKLCHYSNLQPLWAEDNLKKSNKILVKKVI